MIPKQACVFRIQADNTVTCNLDREKMMEAVKQYRCFNMNIYGQPDSSLISINQVVEFFDVKADWQFDWEFRSNEWIEPNLLIAIVQAW